MKYNSNALFLEIKSSKLISNINLYWERLTLYYSLIMSDAESYYDSEHQSIQQKDWYSLSDALETMLEPNLSEEALSQSPNMLPVPLQKSHFEGLIYTITLKGEDSHARIYQLSICLQIFFLCKVNELYLWDTLGSFLKRALLD